MTEKLAELVKELDQKVGTGEITEIQLIIRMSALLVHHMNAMEKNCAGCVYRGDTDERNTDRDVR